MCDKEIRKKSKKIKSKKELEESAKFWRKELKIGRDIKIYCSFSKTISRRHYGGLFWKEQPLFLICPPKAFCYVIELYKKYKLVISSKEGNEYAFVHELLHIKKGHDEKLKKMKLIKRIVWSCKFDVEVNKLIKNYYDLLISRGKSK